NTPSSPTTTPTATTTPTTTPTATTTPTTTPTATTTPTTTPTATTTPTTTPTATTTPTTTPIPPPTPPTRPPTTGSAAGSPSEPSGTLVLSLYRQNGSGVVGLQYPANGPYLTTSGSVPLSTWAHVELHVVTAGSGASTVQVWLNGSPIYQTTTASLGAAGVATV